jgi:hypothetical protein
MFRILGLFRFFGPGMVASSFVASLALASGPVAPGEPSVAASSVAAPDEASSRASADPHPATASVMLVGMGLAGLGAHRWIKTSSDSVVRA